MSERFPAEWLALREPVDHRSRAHALVDELVEWVRADTERRGPSDPSLRVADLAAGTGSNLRYLAPRLPFDQTWALIDHDEELLAHAAGDVRFAAPASDDGGRVAVRTVARSLVEGGREGLGEALDRAEIVTASALFDLVSSAWLRELVGAVTDLRAAALFVLSYDGRISWGQPDPDDERVRAAVNEHQRGDKGFGPALGPDAGAAIADAFASAGYTVRTASSPWILDRNDAELAHRLLDGWASAATELRPDGQAAIGLWRARREARLEAGDVGLEVGHIDVLALPPR